MTSLHLDTINPSLRGVIVCHCSYLLLIIVAKVPAVPETRAKPLNGTHLPKRVLLVCVPKVAAVVLKRSCPKLPGAAINKELELVSTAAN